MRFPLKFLLLLLVYSISQFVCAESLESDAEAVLTKVLRDIRSKIIDTNIPTNDSTTQPTKRDGEVQIEPSTESSKIVDFDEEAIPTTTELPSTKQAKDASSKIERLNQKAKKIMDKKSEGLSSERLRKLSKDGNMSKSASKSNESGKEIKSAESVEATNTETTNTSSTENFVANFVVEPDFSKEDYRPKLEFVPRFERRVFEFMVPEGQNQEPSLVAVVPFYRRFDDPSPQFELINDTRGWFSIGDVKHTVEENYSVDLVQIILKANSSVSSQDAQLNGVYAMAIEAIQHNSTKAVAQIQVEILTIVGESVEMADKILAQLEAESANNSTIQPTQSKVVSDRFESFVNQTQLDLLEKGETDAEKIEYPEIKIELKGAVSNTLSVSELLQNGDSVQDFNIQLATDSPFDEVAELQIEPSNVFVLRPRLLLPGEQSRLIVLDSKRLDFDMDPRPIEFTITAQFVGSSTKQTAKLIVEKRDEPDHPPQFEKTSYTFHVSESAPNNTSIGHILALDEDMLTGPLVDSAVQYTLLGQGSQNFRIADGSLHLNCVADEFSTDCLDYEQTNRYDLLAIAVDQHGLSSEAVPLTIFVEDANDNGPTMDLFDAEIDISDSEIRSPFLISVSDSDSPKHRDNLVELSNDASTFLSLERLSAQLYQIHVSKAVKVGTYHLDITVRDAKGENLSQKTRVRVNILSSTPKVIFKRQRYERNIDVDKLQTGLSLTQLELDGAEKDTIRLLIIEGNPGWLTVEDFGGNVYFGGVPSSGITPGKFNMKIGAIDRDSQRILATCDFQLTIQGQSNAKVFKEPLVTKFVQRDKITSDLRIQMAAKDVELELLKVDLFDDDLLTMEVEKDAVKVEQGQIIVAKEVLQKVNSVAIQLKNSASDETAYLQIFSQRDSQKVRAAEEALSVPKFAAPWINESTTIELRVQEELPLNYTVLCLPARNQLNGSFVTDMEISKNDYFKLAENGCIQIQSRVDFEQLVNKTLNLQLHAHLLTQQATANLKIKILDLDDNAPKIQLLSPKQMPLELAENSKAGQKLAEFLVLDQDYTSRNQRFRYKLSGEKAENFHLKLHDQNQSILVLSVASGAELDREQQEEITLKLTVTDQAGNSNDIPVIIRLLDENDNSPLFQKSHIQVDIFDNWPAQIALTIFNAVDKDAGNNSKITYSLDQNAGTYFEIDPTTGLVTIASSLSGLARPEPYRISVLAIDHGNPPQSAVAELQIQIHEASATSNIDAQEIRIVSPPVEFQLNLTEGMPAGYLIYRVEAVIGMLGESVEGDLLHYSLEPIDASDYGWVSVDENSGDVYLLRTLDYEQQAYITVMDAEGLPDYEKD